MSGYCTRYSRHERTAATRSTWSRSDKVERPVPPRPHHDAAEEDPRDEGVGGGRREKHAAQSAGFLARVTQFLRDTRAEMRRVSWPSAKEVKNTTIITLIAVVFFAVYLFLIDRIWAFLIEHLRTWLGG